MLDGDCDVEESADWALILAPISPVQVQDNSSLSLLKGSFWSTNQQTHKDIQWARVNKGLHGTTVWLLEGSAATCKTCKLQVVSKGQGTATAACCYPLSDPQQTRVLTSSSFTFKFPSVARRFQATLP